MKIRKSKIEYLTHSLNFANFCTHRCQYCYMQKLYRRYNKLQAPKIDTNFSELQLQLEKFNPSGSIMMSTSHDPFMQNHKKVREVAIRILELLRSYPNVARHVRILTKGLIDKEAIEVMPSNVLIGFTISTLDERVQKMAEPFATTPQYRLNMLEELQNMGFKIWVSAEPMLKGMYLHKLTHLKLSELWIGCLNYASYFYAMTVSQIMRQVRVLKMLGFKNYKLKSELINKLRERRDLKYV